MSKSVLMRSLYRSISRRSAPPPASLLRHHAVIRHLHSSLLTPLPRESRHSFAMGTVSKRFFSEDVTRMPDIKDPEIARVMKQLLAVNWEELPDSLGRLVDKAINKKTDDKAGQEALANAFRAAEAIEEFTGIVMSLKTEIDAIVGLSGENVEPLSEEHINAYRVILERYFAYLNSFGPDEGYLKKKVENELGTQLIYLKMRCSGLSSEWGKVSVLGTSGIAGSYVEQRA